jgi:hypothetical protein
MQEVLRVLKPSGRLLIILESYKKGAHPDWKGMAMKLLRSASLSANDLMLIARSANRRKEGLRPAKPYENGSGLPDRTTESASQPSTDVVIFDSGKRWNFARLECKFLLRIKRGQDPELLERPVQQRICNS